MSTTAITATTQAPSVNFAASTTRTVAPVARAPTPLTTMLVRACRPPVRFQCATIPACESVKARNAPTANSGIKRSVTPPKNDEQNGRQERQDPDALRVHQPPPARGERLRQVAIHRRRPAEPRKIRKGRIRGKRKHRENGADRDVVEDAATGHRGRKL